MHEITPTIYRELAAQLIDEIGMRDFYAGAIVARDGEVDLRLICTLIITHDRHEPHTIENIAPVWWELRSTCGAEELCNDFSFGELLTYIE